MEHQVLELQAHSHGLVVPSLIPFNFSAESEPASIALLRETADFLDDHPEVNLRDLNRTITQRRILPIRTSVFAKSPLDLASKLRVMADTALNSFPSKPPNSKPRILGVFTGQGAQWPRMAAKLIETYPVVTDIVDQLENSLAHLPDGPSWSLKEELLKDAAVSRVSEASISQPLTTEVQIVLLGLLKSARVQFEAVVGHSSGEVAAAYAAGYISASDAIRIAYYRGIHLHLAGGPNGEKGTMLMTNPSFSKAQDFCNKLGGGIFIAASNSQTSTTLSGNVETLQSAHQILEGQGTDSKLLHLDKGYHSPHMRPCAEAYAKSLDGCDIQVLQLPPSAPVWISSVYGEDVSKYSEDLGGEYWATNMVRPVLFSQALRLASAAKGPFDVAVTCAPHPVLKRPTLEVPRGCDGEDIPYTGVLSRRKDDIEVFSNALGYLWMVLGDDGVDFRSLEAFLVCPNAPAPRLVTNLPTGP